MRFRRRSIRAKITALLLVPLTALTALWAYTSVQSVSQVWGLMRVSSDYQWFGTPADTLSRALQDERRAAVAYTAASLSADGRPTTPPAAELSALRQAEAATDAASAAFTRHANDRGHRSGLNAAELSTLGLIDTELKGLALERQAINGNYQGWYSVYAWYTVGQDPFFQFRLQLSDVSGGDLARTAQNLIEIVRAREYLSREDAIEVGAHFQGTLDDQQYQEMLSTGATQQLLLQVHTEELPSSIAALYTPYLSSSDYFELQALQSDAAQLGAAQALNRLSYQQWQQSVGVNLSRLSDIDQQAAQLAGQQATSYAMRVIWQDGIAGALGLLAVIATIVISLRIGRRLVRELVELRNGAFELAGVRLPSVMRRLHDGEKVDVAVEAPPLATPSGGRPSKGKHADGSHDELAQVGRAFNAVQRAAIEAAVEQAELRRGISAVFVNLARRSQALLHRQLSLLDEMERRAEDPGELDDLFKLDHLTTRMRRHAEGLIILSGAAPGRTWLRPVRVLDVVRAAVGEIEDYARVRVHRMPPVAVVGGAVSDLVHLLAELVENATVFSPPHTQVRIQGEEVANGFVLEIDDRGLGMGEEPLAAANDRLATGGDFDLGDTDRLGLFVVSRLAARHDVRVSLRRSPYGGTTAVVLLPHALLTPAPPRPGDADVSGVEATGEQVVVPQLTRVARELTPAGRTRPVLEGDRSGLDASDRPALGGPRPHGPESEDGDGVGLTAPRLPRRRRTDARREVVREAPREVRQDVRSETRSDLRHDVLDEDVLADEILLRSDTETAVAPALPRRVRQANLAPQLRSALEPDSASRPAAPAVDQVERTPEQARAVFASFQRGLARGRAAADPAPAPAPAPAPWRSASDSVLDAAPDSAPTPEGPTR
ncbi:sensor histidine kinase [Streptacidiphilus fuscans]|uniref:histidine kinase n=1 Tax=Streptacidiphilus fuscans TaxID=2789292 RepID=A0A931B4L6_9ACTN|nr:nitrate- and nitrite sensing domain-containing protein [Streptacidiphilus fuscans]MBF9070209.1 sensor histidine kinase [Streptacidiphilus fuscans]